MMRMIDAQWLAENENLVEADEFVFVATKEDIRVCAGAFRETLEAVDDWEFQTIMGVTKAEFIEIESRVFALLRAAEEKS